MAGSQLSIKDKNLSSSHRGQARAVLHPPPITPPSSPSPATTRESHLQPGSLGAALPGDNGVGMHCWLHNAITHQGWFQINAETILCSELQKPEATQGYLVSGARDPHRMEKRRGKDGQWYKLETFHMALLHVAHLQK